MWPTDVDCLFSWTVRDLKLNDEQKGVKLYIVIFSVVNFGKDTTTKLHQGVSV